MTEIIKYFEKVWNAIFGLEPKKHTDVEKALDKTIKDRHKPKPKPVVIISKTVNKKIKKEDNRLKRYLINKKFKKYQGSSKINRIHVERALKVVKNKYSDYSELVDAYKMLFITGVLNSNYSAEQLASARIHTLENKK